MSGAAPLVLLPGLDGTDVFFRPLLASLPSSVSARVVCLPPSARRYADQLPHLRAAVADLPEFVVLGWSFSGPLALMWAAAEPERTRGVILAASFVRFPRRARSLAGLAASGPVVWSYRVARRLPGWLLRPRTDAVRRDKDETWSRVPASVMAARLRALSAVDARDCLQSCRPPVLYLASSRDGVVPRHNVDEIVSLRPSVHVRTIDGSHLAMYTNPLAAAEAIGWFVATCPPSARAPMP